MDRLLAPDGCPWDREQTLDIAAAVPRRGDLRGARRAVARRRRRPLRGARRSADADRLPGGAAPRSEGAFDIDAVVAASPTSSSAAIRTCSARRGRRHADKVLAQWDEIKAAEKAAKGKRSACSRASPPALPSPAPRRSARGAARSASTGRAGKARSTRSRRRSSEVRARSAIKTPREIHAEIGDLLLAVVNLARKVGVDAENALVDATPVHPRFEFVEDRLAERGKTPQQSNLEEMDALWNEAQEIRGAGK